MPLSQEQLRQRNADIKKHGAETRARRAHQTCKTIVCKVDESRMSKKQKADAERLFLEAKWLKNDIATTKDVMQYEAPKGKSGEAVVQVRVKEGNGKYHFEERRFTNLSAQERQGIVKEYVAAVCSMSTKKKNAEARGEKPPVNHSFHTVSEVNEIPLPQANKTYRWKGPSLLHISGIEGNLRLEGVDQLHPELIHGGIPSELDDKLTKLFGPFEQKRELANARFLRKESGYYISFVVYEDEILAEARECAHEGIRGHVPETGSCIGIDPGIKHEITLSDGTVIDRRQGDTARAKKAQRQMKRRNPESKGYKQARHVYRLESEWETLRRKAMASDVKHFLHTQAEWIYIQDEHFSDWASRNSRTRGGKAIHSGILGRLYVKLKEDDKVIQLNKWQPTTAWCECCGRRTKHPPGKDVFICDFCGLHEDRDQHAAKNMIVLGDHPLARNELYAPRDIPIGWFERNIPSST